MELLLEVSKENVQPTRWAEQFVHGDRSVGEKLANHVREVLRKRFLSLGLANQDAEDLVQECATMVFDGIQSFDPEKGSLDSWLSGYARNVARSWWRGAYSKRKLESNLDAVSELADNELVSLDGSGSLEIALGSLHPIDQEMLQMRFGFGYSFDEIAVMADLTPVNARKRVSRAVETLRRNALLRVELGFTD